MVQTANTVFRDFETDGVMASGKHKPKKADIRALLTNLENIYDGALAGGGLVYETKADLDADTTQVDNAMAWVLGDDTVANNGIYQFDGAAWNRLGDLPYSYIKASNAGAGTANAIVATTSIPIPAADGGALIVVPLTTPNTSTAVTVEFNGDGNPLTVETYSGGAPSVGGLVKKIVGYKIGTTFSLLTDQASAAIVADAEAAADRAEAAAQSTGLPSIVADTFLRAKSDATGYDALTATELVTALNVKALNADGGVTFSTTATSQEWGGPFGGTWVSAHKFESVEDNPTFDGNRGAFVLRRETVGNDHDPTGTGYIGWTDFVFNFSNEKTGWLTSTVDGEVDGGHVVVRQGSKGDTSAYMFNIKKVYDGAHPSGFTGVEGQSYWVDGTSETEGLHWGIKTTMPAFLKSGDLRSDGVGFIARALGGTVADDNGRTSPRTGLAVIGTAADGGKFEKVLLASPTEDSADRYFQITGGATGDTPSVHFGTPAQDVVLRFVSGVFQIMTTGATDAIVNISEVLKTVDFFGGIKVGGTSGARLTAILSTSVALDFPSVAANSAQSLTTTLTGVAAGDEITVTPSATNGNLTFRAEYDSANTVKVWAQNISASAIDPASVTMRIVARRHA